MTQRRWFRKGDLVWFDRLKYRVVGHVEGDYLIKRVGQSIISAKPEEISMRRWREDRFWFKLMIKIGVMPEDFARERHESLYGLFDEEARSI